MSKRTEDNRVRHARSRRSRAGRALSGLALAALTGLPAGAVFGRSALAGAAGQDQPATTEATATTTGEVELADSARLAREMTDERAVLVAGQIDRVAWIATPSASRSLLTLTVRFVDASGAALDEHSTKVRLTGHADRRGHLDVTVPDGAAEIEIEWLTVGGTVDVHDLDVVAIETAPPAVNDVP